MTFRDPLGSKRLQINRCLNTVIDVASRTLRGTPQSLRANDSTQQRRQAVITQRNERLSRRETDKSLGASLSYVVFAIKGRPETETDCDHKRPSRAKSTAQIKQQVHALL